MWGNGKCTTSPGAWCSKAAPRADPPRPWSARTARRVSGAVLRVSQVAAGTLCCQPWSRRARPRAHRLAPDLSGGCVVAGVDGDGGAAHLLGLVLLLRGLTILLRPLLIALLWVLDVVSRVIGLSRSALFAYDRVEESRSGAEKSAARARASSCSGIRSARRRSAGTEISDMAGRVEPEGVRNYPMPDETATGPGGGTDSFASFTRGPRQRIVSDMSSIAAPRSEVSHIVSHGKIVVDTAPQHGRSLTRRPNVHPTP